MGITHPKYKAAVVQAAPVWIDLEGTVAKTIRYIEEAAKEAAKLIAFPEPGSRLSLVHLGRNAGVGDREGVRTALLRQFPSYDSPLAQRIADAARTTRSPWCSVLSERDGGSLYISQWLIGPDGETIAKRRKLRPTHVERTVFGEGDGSHIAVHDRADLGRLGALCCWEHLQPLTKYAMYAQNEQVHVGAWPSFSMYEPFAHALGWEPTMPSARFMRRRILFRPGALRRYLPGDGRGDVRHRGQAQPGP